LACRRGNEWLFSNLSLDVFSGQIIWLKGHNGRGKTSLLRLITGLATPDKGTINWGQASLRSDFNFREHLVYIGHANGLKDDLTVSESLQFLARLHDRDCTPLAVAGALKCLNMQHRAHALVRTLSQGQRRRVALARLALESEPSLWVLDEPFDALDVDGISVVNRLLLDHAARGGSVLLTSHLALSLDPARVSLIELHHGKSI